MISIIVWMSDEIGKIVLQFLEIANWNNEEHLLDSGMKLTTDQTDSMSATQAFEICLKNKLSFRGSLALEFAWSGALEWGGRDIASRWSEIVMKLNCRLHKISYLQ